MREHADVLGTLLTRVGEVAVALLKSPAGQPFFAKQGFVVPK